MGLVRILLAFSVLFSHLPSRFSLPLIPAGLAVQTFFIVSGFYMSLILSNKYARGRHSYTLFIGNRFLRIYPVYLLVLTAIVLLALVKYVFHLASNENLGIHLIRYYAHSSVPAAFFSLLDDFLRNFTLIISSDYIHTVPRDPAYLLIAQAWTLQLELLFYLLAPFLISRRLLILLALVALLTFLRVAPLPLVPADSLAHNFVSELPYFLFGVFAYRLYRKLELRLVHIHMLRASFALVILLLLFFSDIPFFSYTLLTYANGFYVFLIALALPCMFLLTKGNVLDRLVGNLSYPIYVSHALIIKLLDNIHWLVRSPVAFAVTAILLTIGISILLEKFVDQPIDKLRQLRVQKNKQSLKPKNLNQRHGARTVSYSPIT